MEYKVRQESHSLLEKMFTANAKSGLVSSDLVPALLKEFNAEIQINSDEIPREVSDLVTGDIDAGLDFDNFEKVMVHYLAIQSRKESNEFGHKQIIGLNDFGHP